ncbi:MAG: hypothetical protein IKY07_02785 [Clostridia bacterium]|nr:hypothetical protein [Clostridia bacterium]
MRKLLVSIKKRPILLIFIAFMTAVLCFAVQFNSFTKEFGSFSRLFQTNYIQTLTDIAGWIRNRATQPALMAVSVLIAIAAMLGVAILCGLLYSGYSYVMYVSCFTTIHPQQNKKQKRSGTLFREGINKRFFSMMGYFFFVFISLALLLFALVYATMPLALSIEKVIAGDAMQILPMILLTAIIVFLLFFAVIFYAMYVSFMMPSIIAFKKGAVKVAIKIVNSYCWYLIPRTLAFLIYNLAIEAALLAVGYGLKSTVLSVIVFAANWMLRTIGNVIYTHYVFNTYIEMKDDMFEES